MTKFISREDIYIEENISKKIQIFARIALITARQILKVLKKFLIFAKIALVTVRQVQGVNVIMIQPVQLMI